MPIRDTRPSGPIVSRFQNPALHFRHEVHDNGFFREGDWWDIGLEHISNGQSLTASENKALIQNAYQTNNNAVMDSVSRVGATALLSVGIQKLIGTEQELVAKAYVYRSGQEADVYWGKFANQGVNFNHFQRLSIQWRTRFYGFKLTDLPWQFGAELTVGSLGFSEDSWNFMLNMPMNLNTPYTFPFALTVHRGPMNSLSDYTRPQNTIAFGFTFAY